MNIQSTQESETSQTMQSEDFVQDQFTLVEVLTTFEVGFESGMFKILSRNLEERIIMLRKHYAIIDGKEVLMVIAKDCTDKKNLF